MRDYGAVYSTFWTSSTTQALSDDGRLLALYLMTGPHTTALGCFRLPDGYAMEDLHWSSERVSKGFQELFQNRWANRCETTKWVVIHNFLKFNQPENPNVLTHIVKLALQVPSSASVIQDLKVALSTYCGVPDFSEYESIANPSRTVAEWFANRFETRYRFRHRNRSDSEPKPSKAGAQQKPSSEHGSESPASNGDQVPAMELVLNTGKPYSVTRKQVAEWRELYPAVDVMQQLRNMRGWLESNPKKRKTIAGIARFINTWLQREQDKPAMPKSLTGSASLPVSADYTAGLTQNEDGSFRL